MYAYRKKKPKHGRQQSCLGSLVIMIGGLFRISGEDLTGGVHRDPASQTGYILDDKHVLHVDLIKYFRC
jgi:hypothetical protein